MLMATTAIMAIMATTATTATVLLQEMAPQRRQQRQQEALLKPQQRLEPRLLRRVLQMAVKATKAINLGDLVKAAEDALANEGTDSKPDRGWCKGEWYGSLQV